MEKGNFPFVGSKTVWGVSNMAQRGSTKKKNGPETSNIIYQIKV
jgi:hypothetical protein